MYSKTVKSISIWVFLSLFFFKEAFTNFAYAFSTLDTCAAQPECAAAISSELAPVISAPSGVGYGASTLSTTTATGATTSSVNAVAEFVIVTGPSAGYITWHYWNQANNERAQKKAAERYCQANPTDSVCHGFKFVGQGQFQSCSPDGRRWEFTGYGSSYSFQTIFNGNPPHGVNCYWDVIFIDGRFFTAYKPGTWTVEELQPKPWKDWPQEKRDKAVKLLNDSDWKNFFNSMPEGGRLNFGDRINAPKIKIPGQEVDDPDTPADERILKDVPGFFTWPKNPDFDLDGNPDTSDTDDDNDGIVDTFDPQPKNSSAPIASGDDDSVNSSPGEPDAGSPEHKSTRWEQYQEKGGTWDYERWSQVYDANVNRANKANEAVDNYHQEIGWGQREVTVDAGGQTRRLDIADVEAKRAVEYKTGYAYASEENLSEVTRDAILVQEGWQIEWVFQGSASIPLQQALTNSGITYKFR